MTGARACPAGAQHDPDYRAAILRRHGADAGTLAELLAYTASAFSRPDVMPADYPLPDERFVAAWERYAASAAERGVVPVLREALVQLRFPIVEGISQTEAYGAATQRGAGPTEGAVHPGLAFVAPDRFELLLYPTPAGRIPVIIARERADFETLVRALTRKNEPAPVPPSMGACIVGGYNNWERVARLREAWQAEVAEPSEAAWAEEFRALVPRKEMYQDRFILLSAGPYSAVPGVALGLSATAWAERSLVLRLEHECAHYFTRRVFQSMRNVLLDELLADFMGIVAVRGRYSAGWFLHFLGLEQYPQCRAGGRMENYRGSPPLSAAALDVLSSLVRAAAFNLERLDLERSAPAWGLVEKGRTLATLTEMSLEALGDPAMVTRVWKTALG